MEVWLNDVIRTGFATLPGKPPSFWDTPASRLVDAQAPGLARRLRALQGITAIGEAWPTRLLRQLTTFHLANEAWSRISTLPVETQSDLRTAVGFTVNQDDVLTQESIRDRWMITGQRIEEEERLRVQRTWLFGCNTKRAALCLSFSAGANQPLDVSLVPGTIVDADLAYFPSAFPLRALVKDRHGAAEQRYADYPHATI